MSDEDIEKRWQEFTALLRKTNRAGMEDLVHWLETKTDFKTSPASTRYHLNCKGGLLEHSLNVYYSLVEDFKVFHKLLQIPEDTLIISALLHDICKANTYITEMRNVKRGNEWVQEPFYRRYDTFSVGHGEKSVILAQHYIKLTPVEIMMIRWHMGYANRPQYDTEISEAYTEYPEALLLNWADEVATFLVEGNYEGVEKFSKAGFNNLFKGRSAVESLNILENSQTIQIDGVEYKLAPEDAVVDNIAVIQLRYNGQLVKVYKNDDLPF